jgi:hypothetical protein
MYNQANTIKNYEDIRRVVRGSPTLSLTRKSILTFTLLLGILGGLMLADCWGNIPTTHEQLQIQVKKSNQKILLFEQQHPLKKSKNTGQYQQKAMSKTGRTPAQLRHQLINEKLRKRIRARKVLLTEKWKCKVARNFFPVFLSKPLNKP